MIGIASIIFAVLLWLADKQGSQTRANKDLTTKDAVLIGIAQAFALIPGASRSGVTMTAGMWLGLTRVEACAFFVFISHPYYFGGIFVWGIYKAAQYDFVINWPLTLGVIACSAIVAFLCIDWFLKVVGKIGMLPFVIYRILLGGILLFFYL